MSDTCIRHIENYWKEKTNASNDFFNKKNYAKALSGYKEALFRAEVLSNNLPDCLRTGIPFMQIYIISCNNIANTYKELGRYIEAENMLKQIIYYLLHLHKNTEAKNNEIQCELKRASLTYYQFLEKYKSVYQN